MNAPRVSDTPIGQAPLRPSTGVRSDGGLLEAAFRDVHGPRLHGFALIVSLGNRSLAASVAARALADGTRRAAELRHPERAAAWLRARVLELLPRDPGRLAREPDAERRSALRTLGVTDAAYDALAALTLESRAVLVAGAVERIGERDLELIAGRGRSEVRRLLLESRATYLAIAAASRRPSDAVAPGPLATLIAREAARTLGGRVDPA